MGLQFAKMLKLAFLLILSSAGAFGEKDAGSCPENWVDATLTGMGCLLFNTSEVMAWEDASVSCYHSKSSLVEIETELQLDFLRSELRFLANSGISESWWTSATDLGREGRWYWASSLSPVPNFVWDSDEPSGSTEENCGMLYVYDELDFMMNDYLCEYGPYSAYPICQIK